MKILITTDWYEPVINGVVTSVLNLKRELEQKGHEVKVLTLAGDGKQRVEGNVYYMKSFGIGKIYPDARATISVNDRYVKELTTWHPDVVHSQCEFATFGSGLKIAQKCNAPLLHTYHTVYENYTHYFSSSKTVGKKVVALWSKSLLSKVDGVVVPTEKVEYLLRGYQVEQPIYVVPTGIDIRKYDYDLDFQQKKIKKKELGIPLKNKVLITVGRLAKEKNISEILRSLKKMDRQDVTYLLVGDGPYREELEKEVRNLGMESQVVFSGMVSPEQVGDYYKLGDIFVSASNSETQGLTYVEALANGLPALCRKDDCLKNVIIQGRNGYQYDGDEGFCEYLGQLLDQEDLRGEMAQEAKRWAVGFSTTRFGDKMERIYMAEAAAKRAEGQEYGHILAYLIWKLKNAAMINR